jgi:hypothetical protein
MNLLKRLFGRGDVPPASSTTHAVLVRLDGTGLPDSIYKTYDLATIEDRLSAALSGSAIGELDGHEVGPGGATLYMYGEDAERMFSAIEATLRVYPLCAGARVTLRCGGPGAAQREVVL